MTEITESTDRDRLLAMDKNELIDEMMRVQIALTSARDALKIAQRVCGQNNCNCRGALGVKRAVQKALQDG